jgi:hypothetical protein
VAPLSAQRREHRRRESPEGAAFGASFFLPRRAVAVLGETALAQRRDQPTLKDVPQPQLLVAFGFEKLKPVPFSPPE